MIEIFDIKVATISVAKDLPVELERNLAGDIKNWLLSRKDIICEVGVRCHTVNT